MDNGYQYFKNIIKKNSWCHVLKFDEWMKNDVNMIIWL
jgi:hypothetical protein